MNTINYLMQQKYEFHSRCNISDLFLDDYDCDNWFVSPLECDKKVPPMPPLEGVEEVKEGKGLKILTPNKLLTRHLQLLTQIKAGNNSNKLNEDRQMLYLLYQHNKITKTL